MKNEKMNLNLKSKGALNTRTAKIGGYSFLITAFFLAILIAINVAVSLLPDSWTQFDISSARLYSVTSSTKAVAQNLTKDVTVYWITQSGEENLYVEKLLGVYEGLSSHIELVKKNPDVYPTFAEKYTSETVANNSLVVECGDKYRYIAYADMFDSDYSNYYTTGSVAYSFDGESQITSAINYVVKEELPQIYTLTGHGEAELGDSIATAIERANFETQELSLLTVDEVPEDCDAILVNAPTSDLSEDEAEMLSDYIDNGGRVLVVSGLLEEGELTNLNTLLTDHGITKVEGIVIENDRSAYAYYPYMLLPTIADSEITTEIADSGKYIVTPVAQGLDISGVTSEATATALLSTSETAFSKIDGYNIETYESEEDDIAGPFDLAVLIENSEDGCLIWISCDDITNEDINSYSSGANADFTLNCLSYLAGEEDSISIRAKSLDYSYLTISDEAASRIKLILIAFVPLIYLVFGLDEVLRRRRKV